MIESGPLVSIILPVYNLERFVKQAVESVIFQPYSNIELLICDDASTDSTYEILDKLRNIYGCIKLISNTTNLGISSTLNKLIDISSGKYLMRMDGDDISGYSRVCEFVKHLETNPEIALVGCNAYGIDSDGFVINRTNVLTKEKLMLDTVTLSSPVLHLWMVRRDASINIGNYREVSGVEDYDYTLRMITAGYRIQNLEFVGYSIRIRSGNTASTMGIVQRRLANYVVKMYKQRIKYGDDYFSSDVVKKLRSPSKYSSKMYLISNKMTVNAIYNIKDGNKLLAVMYYAFAFILSTVQAEYFLKKFILMMKSKLDNKVFSYVRK